MPRFVVGYGEHNGWLLEELPERTIRQLGTQFPLIVPECPTPGADTLLVTVAVHSELKRRADGGQPKPHRSSERELGVAIVKRGF